MNGNLCLQQFELSSYVSTLSGLSLANKHLLMTSRGINAGYLSESNREDVSEKNDSEDAFEGEQCSCHLFVMDFIEQRKNQTLYFLLMETTLQPSILIAKNNARAREHGKSVSKNNFPSPFPS